MNKDPRTYHYLWWEQYLLQRMAIAHCIKLGSKKWCRAAMQSKNCNEQNVVSLLAKSGKIVVHIYHNFWIHPISRPFGKLQAAKKWMEMHEWRDLLISWWINVKNLEHVDEVIRYVTSVDFILLSGSKKSPPAFQSSHEPQVKNSHFWFYDSFLSK